jgi:hypothetical protein
MQPSSNGDGPKDDLVEHTIEILELMDGGWVMAYPPDTFTHLTYKNKEYLAVQMPEKNLREFCQHILEQIDGSKS